MGLTTLPTKADGSIGRVKNTLPGSDPSPDLDYYETATEHERMKTALVDVCAAVGLGNGSTAGSLEARMLSGGFAVQAADHNGGVSVTLVDSNAFVTVDTSAGEVILNLPSATGRAGRTYVFRKIGGTGTEAITLHPSGSQFIEGLASDLELPGGDQPAEVYYGQPRSWVVYCTGSAWWLGPIGPLNVIRSGPPDGSSNASPAQGFVVGSTWSDSDTVEPSLWIMTGVDAGDGVWVRVGATSTRALTASASLATYYDELVTVDTASGAVVLTLPTGSGNYGRQYRVQKSNSGTNKISLDRAGAIKVNGVAADYDLPGSDSAMPGAWHVWCDINGDWWVTTTSAVTPQRSVSGSTSCAPYDEVIWVTSSTINVTLAAPVRGRQYLVVKAHAGANAITLVRSGSEQINGASASFVLPDSGSAARGRWHVSCDGTNWEVG